MNVLDCGCGVGDVSFLTARLVGSTGRVLGIDRSVAGINRARERAAEAGLRNVSFEVVDDLARFRPRVPVDAVVGRLILMYLRDPAAILSHFARQVRPSGLIVFQELVLNMCRSEPSCPLREKCRGWIHDTLVQAGADVEMGWKLFATFQRAGLPSPEALKGLTLHVEEGEIVALLGSNGAGKSTTLRTVSGLIRPRSGTMRFLGQPIDRLSPEAIVKLGVAHVPERRRVFPGLTVRENILLGGSNRVRASRRELETDAEQMFVVFPELKPFANVLGWTLSGGQQQMVAIARGLMAQPKLLLLDEPSLGLAPLIVQQVFQIIAGIRGQGTTVLLVEQNAHIALSIADRGYVLETGRLVAEGNPEALWNNGEVRAAYLGGRKMEK